MFSAALAYLIAGAYGVALDLRQPPWNRPAYLTQGNLVQLAAVILLWLPLVLMAGARGIFEPRYAALLAVFLAAWIGVATLL